ncbi:hypothetical protein BDV12DRAFT_172724 [Aspergillus spectabilis]
MTLNFIDERYSIKVPSRTIEARFKSWGIRKKNRTASSNLVLHARIKCYFITLD